MTTSLPKNIFDVKMNENVVHQTVIWYLASQRRGTQSAKTRAEVSGGGKKPWKQKGTGRARAGSSRSPLWRKGGVIFAPKPRDYGYALPKKVKKLALRIALSDKARADKVIVVPEFKLAEAKTKLAVKWLAELKLVGKVLILQEAADEVFTKAVRNVKGIKIMTVNDLNIFDLLNADALIMDKAALTKLGEFVK